MVWTVLLVSRALAIALPPSGPSRLPERLQNDPHIEIISSHYPPYNEIYKAYAGLLDVGDRSVDLECLGDGLAALGAQAGVCEAEKRDP